jgi:hypothetical protein
VDFQLSVGMFARKGYFFTASPDSRSVRSVARSASRPGRPGTWPERMVNRSGSWSPATAVWNRSVKSPASTCETAKEQPRRSLSACQNSLRSTDGGIDVFVMARARMSWPSPGGPSVRALGLAG